MAAEANRQYLLVLRHAPKQLAQSIPGLILDVTIEKRLDRIEDEPGSRLDITARPLLNDSSRERRDTECYDQSNGDAEDAEAEKIPEAERHDFSATGS
ncbi:hypothetical protein WHZ78_17375 [Bradyrhizobium symbiodeficiens]|uniref:hypothetical protein n=1 Tax=Bradyrhizobium TaxID=374 RepID=UPI001FFF2233|nr:hypothetical protein [Bradyrhizobium sp. 192]